MLTAATRRAQLRRILVGVREDVRGKVKDDVDFIEMALSTDTVKKMVLGEHALMTQDDKFLSDRIIEEMRLKAYGSELSMTVSIFGRATDN